MATARVLVLVMGVAGGGTLACDSAPAGLTGPPPLQATNTAALGCNGRTTTAKRKGDTWDVTVFVPNEWGCSAYACTIPDAQQLLTPQGAIVECRRIYGIRGPHA